MFDVGGGELLFILLAILLLFGPEKLPEIAQIFNKGMKQVRKAQTQFQTQMHEIQKEIEKNAAVPINEIKTIKVVPNEFSVKTNDQPAPSDIPNREESKDQATP